MRRAESGALRREVGGREGRRGAFARRKRRHALEHGALDRTGEARMREAETSLHELEDRLGEVDTRRRAEDFGCLEILADEVEREVAHRLGRGRHLRDSEHASEVTRRVEYQIVAAGK